MSELKTIFHSSTSQVKKQQAELKKGDLVNG
jgi:hypothetical protein